MGKKQSLTVTMPAFDAAALHLRTIQGWSHAVGDSLEDTLRERVLAYDVSKPLYYGGPKSGMACWIIDAWTRLTNHTCIIQWFPSESYHIGDSLMDELIKTPIANLMFERREIMTLLCLCTYRAFIRHQAGTISDSPYNATIPGMIGLCMKLDVPVDVR